MKCSRSSNITIDYREMVSGLDANEVFKEAESCFNSHEIMNKSNNE